MVAQVFTDDFLRSLILLGAGAVIALVSSRIQAARRERWEDRFRFQSEKRDLYVRMRKPMDPICAEAGRLQDALETGDKEAEVLAREGLKSAVQAWHELNDEALLIVPEHVIEPWVNLYAAALVLLDSGEIDQLIGGVHINRDRFMVQARKDFGGFPKRSLLARVRNARAAKRLRGRAAR